MIYIDPSELRTNSRLIKTLEQYGGDLLKDETKIQPLSDLELWTGADVMISPKDSPYPSTEKKLKKFHLEKGAVLIQLKFGLDLIASVIDGRFKESQSRMKLLGAAPWQRILCQVGFFYQEEGEIASYGQKAVNVIGGKATNFKFVHLMVSHLMWIFRGGGVVTVQTCDLVQWFEAVELAIESALKSPQRVIFPSSPELYEEELEQFEDKDWIKKEWQSLQEVKLINDWRKMLIALPGVGERKAREIGEHYGSWLEFEKDVLAGNLDVKGVGQKTIKSIQDFIGG